MWFEQHSRFVILILFYYTLNMHYILIIKGFVWQIFRSLSLLFVKSAPACLFHVLFSQLPGWVSLCQWIPDNSFILLDPRRVAVCVPYRCPGALWRCNLLWHLRLGGEAAVGRSRANQWREVWLHWWRWAGWGNGGHHPELRCPGRSSQDLRCHHAVERRMGRRMG